MTKAGDVRLEPAKLRADAFLQNPASSSHEPIPIQVPAFVPNEALRDVVFGSLAGMIGKVIEYPFDTIKVRLQSQSLKQPRYRGPLDCFRQSIATDGIVKGLYRGLSAPIIGAAVETSSLFFTYRVAQQLLASTIYCDATSDPSLSREQLRQNLPFGALVCSGAISGACTSLLLTPIELVKCQMQVPSSKPSNFVDVHHGSKYRTPKTGPNAVQIVSTIFRRHGILGFWHGQWGTLIRETGGSAAWFGSYEALRSAFRKRLTISGDNKDDSSLPLYLQLTAGAVAGVAYNFICFPADTIKSRMQTEDMRLIRPVPLNFPESEPSTVARTSRGTARESFWTAGKVLWHEQGVRGMYRGCGITVLRAAPSSAFIFTIYEGLQHWWDSRSKV